MLPWCFPFQQALSFLNPDLLGMQAVENRPPINTAIGLRWTTKRCDNLIQTAACRVVSNIQVSRYLLNIAPALDQQLDEIELFAAQATDPAQAEASLDHNAAFGTLQASDDQLTTAHGVPGDKWMHVYAPSEHGSTNDWGLGGRVITDRANQPALPPGQPQGPTLPHHPCPYHTTASLPLHCGRTP